MLCGGLLGLELLWSNLVKPALDSSTGKKTCIRPLRFQENMVPKLEAIRGGGGSVKVGTTGTIGALISRELESTKLATQRTIPTLVPIAAAAAATTTTSKRPIPRASLDEASSSSSSSINKKSPETIRKMKHYRKTHQLPMLGSDSMSLDRTPRRDKPNKRGSYIVEIVDLKCGSRKSSRLKKLSFSKLSESVA